MKYRDCYNDDTMQGMWNRTEIESRGVAPFHHCLNPLKHILYISVFTGNETIPDAIDWSIGTVHKEEKFTTSLYIPTTELYFCSSILFCSF